MRRTGRPASSITNSPELHLDSGTASWSAFASESSLSFLMLESLLYFHYSLLFGVWELLWTAYVSSNLTSTGHINRWWYHFLWYSVSSFRFCVVLDFLLVIERRIGGAFDLAEDHSLVLLVWRFFWLTYLASWGRWDVHLLGWPFWFRALPFLDDAVPFVLRLRFLTPLIPEHSIIKRDLFRVSRGRRHHKCATKRRLVQHPRYLLFLFILIHGLRLFILLVLWCIWFARLSRIHVLNFYGLFGFFVRLCLNCLIEFQWCIILFISIWRLWNRFWSASKHYYGTIVVLSEIA